MGLGLAFEDAWKAGLGHRGESGPHWALSYSLGCGLEPICLD